MLSGNEIKRLNTLFPLQCERTLSGIHISDFDEKRLNPNSYNLRLADKLLVYEGNIAYVRDAGTGFSSGFLWNWLTEDGGMPWPTDDEHNETNTFLDVSKEPKTRELTIPENGLILHPGILYLGSTMEYTETHGLAPCIEGRSSLGRLGLGVHVTAGFGDVQFKGTWTLELTTVFPLRIFPGMEVCQISYYEIRGEIKSYAGKYKHQSVPRASEIWREFVRPKEQSGD